MSTIINKIKNTEKIDFRKIYSKISNVEKAAFITVMVLGLLTHIFMFVNVLPNWDSMYNFKGDKIWIHMGRWFLNESQKLSSIVDIPWVIGMLSLVFIGITCAIIVNVLEIKKMSSAIAISAIIVTFPVVTSTFSYMFLADGYMMGMMLSALAVFITKKYKRGYIVAGVILAFAIGIYQVNLGFAVLLSLLVIMLKVFNKDEDIVDNIKYAMRFVIMALIGMVLYFIILKVFIFILHRGLGSYQGADQGFSINKQSILNILTEFKNLPKVVTGGYDASFSSLILLLFVFAGIMLLYLIKLNKIYKDILKLILVLVALVSIPFITGFAYFISEGTAYHMVMRMSWSLLFVAIITLNEKISIKKGINNLLQQIVYSLPLVITWIIIWNFILVANISYLNMHQRYEKEYSLAVRVVDRLEMSEEYNPSTPVLFAGSPYTHNTPGNYSEYIGHVTGTDGNSIFFSDYHFNQFIKYYIGLNLNSVSDKKANEIMSSEEYKSMKSFPNKECIKKIDDVVVVKFS